MIWIRNTAQYGLNNNSATCTIPKPANMAVGDVMVALIHVNRSATITPPSGWTAVGDVALAYARMYIYKKIATATDVSASNFVWTGDYNLGGIIYALVNANFNNINVHATTLTPSLSDNLAILYGISSDNDSDTCAWSGYAVTGGMSPTFTEDFDTVGISSTYYASMGVASGSYTSSSAITGVTVNASTAPDDTARGVILIGGIPTYNLQPFEFPRGSNTKLLLHLSNSYDYSLNNNAGTETDITYASGKFQNCAVFNGTSSKILYATPAIPLGAKTISYWIKSSYTGNYQTVFDNGKWETDGVYGFNSWIGITDGKVRFSLRKNTIIFITTSTGSICDGNWNHVLFTWDGTTDTNGARLYINGTLNAVTTSSSTETDTPSYNLMIGAVDTASPRYFLNGSLDEMIIEDFAWSPEKIRNYYEQNRTLNFRPLDQTKFANDPEIEAYYKFENGALNTDSSGNGKTLSTNGTPTSVTGKFSGGISQDISNYSYINDNFGLSNQNWAISTWVKFGSNNQHGIFCYVGNGGSNGFGFLQNDNVSNGTGNYLSMLFGGVAYVNTGVVIPDTTNFHHLVLTRGTVTTLLYLDGVLVFETTASTPNSPSATTSITNTLATGIYIDDTAFFSRTLTSAEVAEIYAGHKFGEFIPNGSTKLLLHLNGSSADSSYQKLFIDDFGGASLDTDKWTITNGTPVQSAGVLTVTATTGEYCDLISDVSFGDKINIEWYGVMPQTSVGTTYFGLGQSISFKHKWQDTTKTYIVDDLGDHALDAKYTGSHSWRIERNGSTAKFYIDGVLKYTSTSANTANQTINFLCYGQTGENTFTLDTVRVYYGGYIKGVYGTDTDIYYSKSYGKFGLGAYFNGISSQISIPITVDFNKDFTFAFWFKGSSETSGWHWFVNLNGYGDGSASAMSLTTNGLKVRWNYGVWFTDGLSDYASQAELSNGVWYHVVYQRTGDNLKTYLNGSQLGSTTATTVSNIPTTGNLYFSRSPENNQFYNGYLDEVIIENTAWSAEKIKKYYTMAKGRFGII